MKIKKKKRKERKSIGNMIYIYNETSDWSSNKNRKLIRSQSSNKRLPRNGFLRKIKKKKEENKKKRNPLPESALVCIFGMYREWCAPWTTSYTVPYKA